VRAANAKSLSSGKGVPSPAPPEVTTEEMERVRAIRSALARGHATHQQIADRFGVSRDLVSRIKSGKSYAGVGGDIEPSHPTNHETSDDQHLNCPTTNE